MEYITYKQVHTCAHFIFWFYYVVLFSGHLGSWNVCCLHLTIEYRSCARDAGGTASLITTD